MSRYLLALASTVLVGLVAQPAAAQTVDDLIAKNLQAHGGLELIKATQSLKMTAHIKSQGMEMPMTLYSKRPNLTRKEVTVGPQKIVFAFDGSVAWQVNPVQGGTEPIVMEGPELDMIRQESDFDSPFVDSKARGYVLEFVGAETLDGRKLQHFKVTRKNATQDCYLDADSGLEARTVNQSPMGALTQEFSDYRDVHGLKLPFLIRTLQNGTPVAEIKIDTIDVNPTLDPALFRKPVR